MPRHTTLGTTNRGELTLSLEDRLRHLAVIGSTGAGKSTLLRHLINQDLSRGDGCLLLDPMGDLSEAVVGDVPEVRHNHVAYMNLADLAHPVGLNVLEATSVDDRARVVDGVVNAMESIWFSSWGPRMELILRHACRALIETPNASLALLPRLLTDDAFRASVVARLANHDTRMFFGARFDQWRDNFRDEAIDPVLNKVEAFLAFPSIKNIVGQNPSTLHLDYAMQHQRIVIVNLAMGTVGETAARLMGALILANVRAAAMARARIPPAQRRPFHVYVDEAHSFGPASFARLLSEIRQFKLSIAMSTQFLDGLTDSTRAALLGNAKTLVAFRCGPGDAKILAQNFNRLHEEFNPTGLLELADGECFVAAPGREGIRVERSEVAARIRAACKSLQTRHVARMLLIGVYTGTRPGAILALRWLPSIDAGWFDLDAGVLYRTGSKVRQSKKRQPPAKIHGRLMPHLRRWRATDAALGITSVVHYKGERVRKLRRSWESVAKLAGSASKDGPHILRHTAATWMMRSGVDAFEASGFLGMTPEVLWDVYGHHHPKFQQRAAAATGKPERSKVGSFDNLPSNLPSDVLIDSISR